LCPQDHYYEISWFIGRGTTTTREVWMDGRKRLAFTKWTQVEWILDGTRGGKHGWKGAKEWDPQIYRMPSEEFKFNNLIRDGNIGKTGK
jgi:hypothetical protein